jgi:hypothetical protein
VSATTDPTRASTPRAARAADVPWTWIEFVGAWTYGYLGRSLFAVFVGAAAFAGLNWIDPEIGHYIAGGAAALIALVFGAYARWRYERRRESMAQHARARAEASDLVTAHECRACRALHPVDEVTCTACGAPLGAPSAS